MTARGSRPRGADSSSDKNRPPSLKRRRSRSRSRDRSRQGMTARGSRPRRGADSFSDKNRSPSPKPAYNHKDHVNKLIKRPGDWYCPRNPLCDNLNFGWRPDCNKCGALKPTDAHGGSSKPSFDIYIGNYPASFRENDVRNLFQEIGVTVTSICMKNNGDKVFAFAKTSSEADVQKAKKALYNKEIQGQRLRVQSVMDKDQMKAQAAQDAQERAPFEIYIGNYPTSFLENDVRNLFQEIGVTVKTIRLKHNGDKVFAFAETSSEADIQTAIKALDSKEIHGRKLRVNRYMITAQATQDSVPFEIYISNYPTSFCENDVRNLFLEIGVTVKTISLKRKAEGDNVFAFAETSSEADIQTAIKALDSKEIHGQRLHVKRRMIKDNKQAQATQERAPFLIYIGNYPKSFCENDVRNLFQEVGVTVKTIRLNHHGDKVFAFAETSSEADIQTAIEALDSKEIHGQRLLVSRRMFKVNDKVMIPQEEHPKIDFFRLLIGPKGKTLKLMEIETGAQIEILGKGGRDKHREDEPLHAYVTSTNPEAVKKAVDKIRNIIKEELDRRDRDRRRELPNLNEVNDKVMIPQEEHPKIDFVGQLIGPRGNTIKSIESKTGAKILILGKGSKVKRESKIGAKIERLGKGRKDGKGEDEPLHAYVTSKNPEAVKKAVDEIRNIIKEELGCHQLRELANLKEVNDKVMIPLEEHPEFDFVRLLIGPRGNILKSMESETGAKIIILGKGSKIRSDGKGDDEPLHAYITSTNPEAVKKAVDKIRNIIKEELGRLSHLQLQELANLNEVNDKVMIPQEEHPEIDFLRLLIGPCGNTMKAMISETGAKIEILGKGCKGRVDRKGDDEPLHAYVTSTNPEAVKKAVDKIRNEIKEAIKALDSKEIHDQSVQSKDKDKKQAQASTQERKRPAPKRKLKEESPAAKRELKQERLAPKSELKEDDVTHHLVFAINRFLDRQAKKKSVDEEKAKKFEQARDLLKEAFDIPDDDSLKINQNLEGIFLQNCAVQREIPIPPAPEVEGE